ncbi:VOC family protein [Pseudohongiella acticola]|jgi:predicted 3-demethylubiquinone-9 3-methyltransferase (glyoxalase superfamily)|uniref:VOC family protein n=1 Tax=Pseudohongiella acticola TaxID=1524254 RepID=UPI0030EC7E47
MHDLSTCLMFEGNAEAAMTLYLSLFKDSEILHIQRAGAEGPGTEGSIVFADIRIGSHRLRCLDSPVTHKFSFTPSTSLLVDCLDEAEQQRLYDVLADGGELLMPLDNYGFSQRYAWLNDRYGVSWQLNLP